MDDKTRQIVRQRADDRCEYCRLRQQHAPLWRHQIEHVIPIKHGGTDALENLAWTCVRCNLSKSSNLSGIDESTGLVVELFNPRKQNWAEHFAYQDAVLVGITPSGRATVAVLNMNEPKGWNCANNFSLTVNSISDRSYPVLTHAFAENVSLAARV